MRMVLVVLGAALAVVLAVQARRGGAESDADVSAPFGAPIPGLEPDEVQRFERGRGVFTQRFGRAEGLGPHFNAAACVSCHEEPAVGGSSQRYRDFFLCGRRLADGRIVKLYPSCGDLDVSEHKRVLCLPSLVIPHYGPKGLAAEPVAADVEHPRIPGGDDIVVARRNAPPLFGVGLLRLVGDDEILARADPEDLDGDGVSGRPNFVTAEDGRLGRFGFKCQAATIEAFNRGALQNQMGITSDSTDLVVGSAHREPPDGVIRRLFGSRAAHAQAVEPRDRIVDFDGVADPELKRGQLLDLIFYQETLAAPRRGRITAAVRRGEVVFDRAGCAACHVPALATPLGQIHPYSDLLLHDLGPELADGIRMEGAGPGEFRTQPLWGVSQHGPFLHDGSADTVEGAIRLHGGEAAAARGRYAGLDAPDRSDLCRFLESL